MSITLKTALYEICLQQAEQRITTAHEAMNAAQAAANTEGRSSAGDKYETGRAMMQLERDQNARLLAEAMKLKQALDNIDPGRHHEKIQAGSLVATNQGSYFISISLGKLSYEGEDYMAISPVTPLGASLMGLKKGDTATFGTRKIHILDVL